MAHPVLSRYFMAHSELFSTNLNATAYLLLPSLNGCFQLDNVLCRKIQIISVCFLEHIRKWVHCTKKNPPIERVFMMWWNEFYSSTKSQRNPTSVYATWQAHTRQFWKQKGAKRASVYPTSVRKLLAYMTYKKADSLNQLITKQKTMHRLHLEG